MQKSAFSLNPSPTFGYDPFSLSSKIPLRGQNLSYHGDYPSV